MRRTVALALVALVFAVGACATKDPKMEAAKEAEEARNLVERARIAVESMSADPKFGVDVRAMMAQAKGVFIAPEVLRGAVIFGGSGGSGVLLTRGSSNMGWNGPAFYTMGDVSWGLQIGADSSDILLLAMTDRGASALLATSVKLGGSVGVAAGPVGGGAAAATANVSSDILSYSRSKGVYAGISLDGAVIKTREDWNRSFYGRDASTSDILVRGTVYSSQAAGLIQAVNKAVAAK